MISRTGVIALLITLCLSGCSTTKPVAWKAQDVSFAEFKAFEIQPVFNATDRPVKQDVLSFLAFYLKEQFKVQNLPLTDTPKTKTGVLVVQSDILVYEASQPANTGFSDIGWSGAPRTVSRCTIRTSLSDKSTGQVVAIILTVKGFGMGGIGYETHEWILKESAAAVAKEVAKIMQPKGSG